MALTLALTQAAAGPAPGAEAAPSSSPTGSGGLQVAVPARAVAGSPVTVLVTGSPDGATVSLVLIGSLGTSTLTAVASTGRARFDLPPDVTRASGTLTVLAASGAQLTGRATLDVEPGRAAGPVQAVVGARSIVADARDLSMVVTTPVDAWGNAVADGTPVLVSRSSPTGALSASTVPVSHLVAWQDLPSGTVAGRGQVWVATGARTGAQVSLDEVAGPPVPFTLSESAPQLAAHTGADGRTLVPVRTSLLRDRYGNVEPDGTSVVVRWEGEEGASEAEALTVDGVAELSVQAPATPQTLTFTARCRGTDTVGPLRIGLASVVAVVPVSARRSATDLAVTVGPVDRTTGTFVPDGAVVALVVRDGSGHAVTGSGALVQGQVTVGLPTAGLSGPLAVTATVLGTSGSTSVP